MKRQAGSSTAVQESRLALPAPSYRSAGAEMLSPALQCILRECQQELAIQEGEVDSELGEEQRKQLVITVATRYGFELSSYECDLIVARIEQEQSIFGILQDLVDDAGVSDIIVPAFNQVTVQHNRRNYSTAVRFYSQDNYESFVERLLSRAGTTYSLRKPIADGMIGSFARIHAVHASIAEGGPYLTIRFNRFARVTLADLAAGSMAPAVILDYLRAIIESGNTVLISGEVGTGKTTLVRALANTIPDDESILVIEDTAEIKLDHPHVRYLQTREANNDGVGRISPAECIHGGMRMAMNRILFGEIRTAEAAEAFIDVCASGHPGVTTIHARSAQDTIARLELFLGRAQRGAAQHVLQQQIAHAVQVVVHVGLCKKTRRRCILEVIELSGVADGTLRHKPLFAYDGMSIEPAWIVRNRMSTFREQIESLPHPFLLAGLPARLSPGYDNNTDEASAYSEAMQ